MRKTSGVFVATRRYTCTGLTWGNLQTRPVSCLSSSTDHKTSWNLSHQFNHAPWLNTVNTYQVDDNVGASNIEPCDTYLGKHEYSRSIAARVLEFLKCRLSSPHASKPGRCPRREDHLNHSGRVRLAACCWREHLFPRIAECDW